MGRARKRTQIPHRKKLRKKLNLTRMVKRKRGSKSKLSKNLTKMPRARLPPNLMRILGRHHRRRSSRQRRNWTNSKGEAMRKGKMEIQLRSQMMEKKKVEVRKRRKSQRKKRRSQQTAKRLLFSQARIRTIPMKRILESLENH